MLYVNTTLASNNIYRLEEMLSGAGTSHRVKGIAVQTRNFDRNLLPPPGIEQTKTRKRIIDPSVESPSSLYTTLEILAEARKKNLRRILVRLHANEMLYLGTPATFQSTDLEANQIARYEEDVEFFISKEAGSTPLRARSKTWFVNLPVTSQLLR